MRITAGIAYTPPVPSVLLSQIDPLEQDEIPPEYDRTKLRAFISTSKQSGGAELSNAQSIFRGLCEALGVPPPALKKAHGDNPYVFEEDVKEGKAHRRIDVYRRGSFVFEAKQRVDPKPGEGLDDLARAAAKAKIGHSRKIKGAGVRGTTPWLDTMRSGRHQAGNYAVHATQRGDPKPPFLLVADVGACLWIWSSFSADARDDYGDFEPTTAIAWDDLERPEVFRLLRQIWLEPDKLNEEARGQRVTAEIATRVSKLALRLERRFDPESVGDFLMKCVFTMFAEDVGFLPLGLFTSRLRDWIREAQAGRDTMFVRGLRALWTRMRDGGDLDTGHPIRRFNGYLFRNPDPLALQVDEMEALLTAALADWRRVSPAIFGTLLERALSAPERQRLGAHYTPEAYIRRLVDKTIMAPLRAEWTATRAQMELAQRTGKDRKKAQAAALALGHGFRTRLTSVRVLDPACGSGNFLYVALKEMKRLEGELVRALDAAGNRQRWLDIPGETVHPAQFFGIEVKPWAAKIAELVLWIGYLQWQVSARRMDRTPEPVLQDLQHIRNADALITYKGTEDALDEHGKPILRARGVTHKKAERTMVPVKHLRGVRVADWPDADFIVGNPPFLGNKRLNDVLEPGYVDAIKSAYSEVPKTADLVMYWWWRCAELLKNKKLERFGLVTTNSITQKLNRAVVAEALEKKGVKIAYAIPDHPWYDEGAAVRIAMTVGASEVSAPVLGLVTDENRTSAAELEQVRIDESSVKVVHADLAAGVDVGAAVPLRGNEQLTFQGMNPVGEGFRLLPDDLPRLGYSSSKLPRVIRPYVSGRDLVQRPEERYIIDFFGLSSDEAAKQSPRLYEHVLREVKPQRDRQNDRQRKEKWWLFGRSSADLRAATAGLSRYVATCRTSKYRLFFCVDAKVVPNTEVVVIALEDFAFLAVLSSRVHVTWATRVGGWLGVGNDSRYNHLDCFGKFPFPSLSPEQGLKLRTLGERLDAHRKARQKEHPELTLTDAYNVLTKLRERRPLDEDDPRVREMGLVDTLMQIHDDIDRATFAAYGFPTDLSDDAILERLVAQNAERATEEARGVIRWLRPEYQATTPMQAEMKAEEETAEPDEANASKRKSKRVAALLWPADMPGRIRVLTALLRELGEPTATRHIAMAFHGAKLDEVEINLRCAAAADAVIMTELDDGEIAWSARAS
jgi:hypothetical protein